MNGFLYTEQEIRFHADWLLFGPAIDWIEHLSFLHNRPVKVLDVGCSTGALARMLGTRKVSVSYVGVDLALANLKAGSREYGIRTFALADIYNLPFPDLAFDVSVCYGVFQSLQSPIEPLLELHRVARSTIVEIVETPVGINSFREQGFGGLKEPVTLFNQEQLLQLLLEKGIRPPGKIISRSAASNLAAAKPFYRNIPYRARSIYFWN